MVSKRVVYDYAKVTFQRRLGGLDRSSQLQQLAAIASNPSPMRINPLPSPAQTGTSIANVDAIVAHPMPPQSQRRRQASSPQRLQVSPGLINVALPTAVSSQTQNQYRQLRARATRVRHKPAASRQTIPRATIKLTRTKPCGSLLSKSHPGSATSLRPQETQPPT